MIRFTAPATTHQISPTNTARLVACFAALYIVSSTDARSQVMVNTGDSVGQVSPDLSDHDTTFGNKCREVRAVRVSVAEPFTNYLTLNDARARAIKRAGHLAINSVVGQSVRISSQSRIALENDVPNSSFISQMSSSTGGYVTYTLTRAMPESW